MDVNPNFFFRLGATGLQLCSLQVFPRRHAYSWTFNQTSCWEWNRIQTFFLHTWTVPCVYTLYFKRIPTSIKNEILILWKLQICNTRLSSTRQAPSIFFFIGVEAYPKSWQTPIFYSQTLNTREGDAGNSHYKILYVKLSFSLCILTCRVPKMWVGQSSPHFSTCMYICKFNKKVSVINF